MLNAAGIFDLRTVCGGTTLSLPQYRARRLAALHGARTVPPLRDSARGEPLARYSARVTSRKAKLDARGSSAVSYSSQRMVALDRRPCGGFAAGMRIGDKRP